MCFCEIIEKILTKFQKDRNEYEKIVYSEKIHSYKINYSIFATLMILLPTLAGIINEPLTVIAVLLLSVIITSIIYKLISQGKHGFTILKSSEIYFTNLTYEKMVLRWKMFSRTQKDFRGYFVIIAAGFAFTVFIILSGGKTNIPSSQAILIFLGLLFAPLSMIYAQKIVKNSITGYNDFYFFMMRGTFHIITKFSEIQETEKMHYVISGLGFYNEYLIKEFGLKLTQQEKIYLKIFGESSEIMNKNIDEIKTSSEGQKLDLLRWLEKSLKSEYGKDSEKPSVQLIVKKVFTLKIKQWLGVVGPVIYGVYQILSILLEDPIKCILKIGTCPT